MCLFLLLHCFLCSALLDVVAIYKVYNNFREKKLKPMIYTEFALSREAAEVVRGNLRQIKDVFEEVDIRFQPASPTSPKIQRITVGGPSEDICTKVKNYMTSLCNPSVKATIEIPLWLENDISCLKDIQRKSSTFIYLANKQKLCIQGTHEVGVVMANSFIEAMKDGDVDLTSEPPLSNDKDCVDVGTSGSESSSVIDEINKMMKKSLQIHSNSQTEDHNEDDAIIEKGEVAGFRDTISERVCQFALKLGYNDKDIMEAASKVSATNQMLNEDTLLQELVKQSPHKVKPLKLPSNLTCDESELMNKVVKTVAEITKATSTLSTSSSELHAIVIDGSNVAMCHGHKEHFSCSGIEIVVNWFKTRGHHNIIVFVPHWRLESSKDDSPITDQEILLKLQKERTLVFTPSRRINGRRIVCYDDRYIVKYAFDTDSVIVSNDSYRDLQKENPEWKAFIENRVLMYTFVNDRFMPPDDPLGRVGVNLDNFLKKNTNQNRVCPYKSYCTYGDKCRYYHPEKDKSNSSTFSNNCSSNSKHINNNNISSFNNKNNINNNKNDHNKTDDNLLARGLTRCTTDIKPDLYRERSQNLRIKSCHFEGLSEDMQHQQFEVVAKGFVPSNNEVISTPRKGLVSNASQDLKSKVSVCNHVPLNKNAMHLSTAYTMNQEIMRSGHFAHSQNIRYGYKPKGREPPPQQQLFQQQMYKDEWENNSRQVYSQYIPSHNVSTRQSYQQISRHQYHPTSYSISTPQLISSHSISHGQHPSQPWNAQYNHPAFTGRQLYEQSSNSSQYMLHPMYPVHVHPQHTYSSPQIPYNGYERVDAMPHYVNLQSIEQYNEQLNQVHAPHPLNPVNAPYNGMSVETAEVQHLHPSQNYLLRSESNSQKDARYDILAELFPGRSEVIFNILTQHSNESDINVLASYLLNDR